MFTTVFAFLRSYREERTVFRTQAIDAMQTTTWIHGPFSPTRPVFQDTKYLVNGVQMTIQQVTDVRFANRTVEHWKVLVDWDLQRSRQYVVVDPLDPSSLLYLSYADYLSVMKVALSNQQPLLVVANPKTSAPVPIHPAPPIPPSSQNSPYMVELESKWNKSARLTWKHFLNLQNQVKTNVSFAKGTKMVTVSPITVARTMYLWWRELLHYIEVKHPVSYLRYLIPTVSHVKVLLQHNGQAATISYLKVSLFAVYSYVFGNPLKTTIHLGVGVRLRKGLPRFLDSHLRDGIRQGHPTIIRLIASLLNIYRALYAKHGDPDLSTITQASPDFKDNQLFDEFCTFSREVFPKLVASHFRSGKLPFFKYESSRGMIIRSAGANVSGPSMASIILDASAWCSLPGQSNHISQWFGLHKDYTMMNLVHTLAGETHWGDWSRVMMANRSPVKVRDLPVPGKSSPESNPRVILGRLHAIDEPAGKVRIVAIADYFTQAAMKSVHEFLFSILKSLSKYDGTFDQDGVTLAYFNRGFKPHWSYDLKAATDTIPLALYKEVLSGFLRSEGESEEQARSRVELWAKVLVDREWMTPDGLNFVKYGTGQPMGALSSWASMALVHHALIQFAAKRVGHRGWFKTYLVLGDDVDISVDRTVADSYREVCSAFSIRIGIAKSLTSDSNSFEFANRRFAPFGDISPLSLKEELSASTWMARGEYAKRILARFGTSLKDESVALLRKATTASQWYRLIPELSGLRASVFSRIVRYCLLNPFSVLEPKEIRVSHILDWLALLVPSGAANSILRDNDGLRRLTLRIVHRLIKSVEEEAQGIMDKVPFPGFFTLGPPSCSFPEGSLEAQRWKALTSETLWDQPTVLGIQRRLWCAPEGAWPSSPRKMRRADGVVIDIPGPLDLDQYLLAGMHRTLVRAPLAFQYFLYCSKQYNDKIGKRVETVLANLQILKGFIPQGPSAFARADHPALQVEPMGRLLELWMELRSIPKAINLDFMKGIGHILDYQGMQSAPEVRKGMVVADENLRQRVFGPLKEVSEVVARETGLYVPGLPFFNDNRRGKLWARTIKQALRVYRRYAEVADRLYLGEVMYERLFAKTGFIGYSDPEPTPISVGPYEGPVPATPVEFIGDNRETLWKDLYVIPGIEDHPLFKQMGALDHVTISAPKRDVGVEPHVPVPPAETIPPVGEDVILLPPASPEVILLPPAPPLEDEIKGPQTVPPFELPSDMLEGTEWEIALRILDRPLPGEEPRKRDVPSGEQDALPGARVLRKGLDDDWQAHPTRGWDEIKNNPTTWTHLYAKPKASPKDSDTDGSKRPPYPSAGRSDARPIPEYEWDAKPTRTYEEIMRNPTTWDHLYKKPKKAPAADPKPEATTKPPVTPSKEPELPPTSDPNVEEIMRRTARVTAFDRKKWGY
jgi:hypothetical protein